MKTDLPDPRLWDHEPLQWQRWRRYEYRVVPLEEWTSEQTRDAEWGAAHGWQWLYYPDGSKDALVPDGRTVHFPAAVA